MSAATPPSTHPHQAQARPQSARELVDTQAGLAREKSQPRTKLAAFTGKALFGTLLLVLLTAPFEAGYPPLGRVLWTTYTNLEVALFLMGAVWLLLMLVSADARGRLLKLPLLAPMLALLAACAVSTLFGEYKSLGVQFIYRLFMGMIVFAAAWEALRNRRRLLAALGLFVGAGAFAAIIGLLEFAPWVNLQSWLQVFKPQPTTVGGMLRLSGTFEYANGAAAYFEMALPVLLGLVALFSSDRLLREIWRREGDGEGDSDSEWGGSRTAPTGRAGGTGRIGRWALMIVLYLALAVLTMALILTFSRAAWLGVIVALIVFGLVAVLSRRTRGDAPFSRGAMRSLGLALMVMALGATYIYATHPLLVLRLTGENDRDWYKNTISPGPVPTLHAGEFVTVPVTVRNEGPMPWWSVRAPVVHLSYHWRQQGKPDYAVFEGERTRLPRDVGPNESVTVEAVLLAPYEPGTYELEWDMVQEDVAWFYQKSKSRTPAQSYTVQPSTGAAPAEPPAQLVTLPKINVEQIENSDTSTVPRAQLWKAAFAMFLDHPITGVGPDGFRHLYGRYAGKTEWNRNIYTNNTYIEMFTNLGILGGVAFLWLVGLALWRAGRNLLRERISPCWIVALGATSALTAFLAHGLVDYFLFSTPLYIAFWFIMAVSVCWTESQVPGSRFKVVGSR